MTLDQPFYEQHGLDFHNQNPQDPQACIDLVKSYGSITYLNHQSAAIRLQRADGPRTGFTVFGSPYSPRHGLWAFGYDPSAASKLWQQIPLETDVVITHTPPKYHCDEKVTHTAMGCERLREELWRIRPSLAISGHIHEARGVERVLWDLNSPNIKYKELATEHWEDPSQGNKKQSLIDLSSKGGKPLSNRGTFSRSVIDEGGPIDRSAIRSAVDPEDQSISTRGQGGVETSGRCDGEALLGRMDRRETCIINAAIMASSWPYKARMGRKHNKPIIVDLDLPVWSLTLGMKGCRG